MKVRIPPQMQLQVYKKYTCTQVHNCKLLLLLTPANAAADTRTQPLSPPLIIDVYYCLSSIIKHHLSPLGAQHRTRPLAGLLRERWPGGRERMPGLARGTSCSSRRPWIPRLGRCLWREKERGDIFRSC